MRVLAFAVIVAGCTSSAPAGVGAPPGELDEVTTFWLPTNAPRLGASARVSPRICVGLVWSFTGKQLAQHCDDFEDDFPYAVVIENEDRCGEVWDYRPNAVVQEIHGCMTPADDAAAAELDITARISGALYVGEIHLVAP